MSEVSDERLIELLNTYAGEHGLEFADYHADGEYHAVLRLEGFAEPGLAPDGVAKLRASSADKRAALEALLAMTREEV